MASYFIIKKVEIMSDKIDKIKDKEEIIEEENIPQPEAEEEEPEEEEPEKPSSGKRHRRRRRNRQAEKTE